MNPVNEERKPLLSTERFDILARDNFTCLACGSRPGNELLHVDHLLPWSRGGSNDPLNLSTLCKRCNMGKLDRVWIPPALLLRAERDKEGFTIWKRFGSWDIEVCDSGILANWPKNHGYTWFGIERCWEYDWISHFEKKRPHVGCDDECRAQEENEEREERRIKICSCGAGIEAFAHQIACSYFNIDYIPRYHQMLDLAEALHFLRRIYRDPAPGKHWWQKP